jgi:hypothetical protein
MREEIPLPLLLLLLTPVVMGGVGPTWRRETPVYSTLPDPNNNNNIFQAQQPNNVNFPQQPPFQGQPLPQQQFQGPLQEPFAFQGPQQDPQQQFQFQQDSFLPIQDQGFDDSNNQLEESSSIGGTLSGLMNSLLEGTGLGGVLDRMSEMWENLTGGVFGGMSRVMMGMLALPFMIPMAAIPLGVGAMALMAFPILQLTLPGIRRSFREGAVLTQSVLVSEECMERLSCNLAKRFPYDSFFSRLLTPVTPI